MAQTCTRCSRVNPKDASYCYWDGSVLQSGGASGPINPGRQPFPMPFVFPSGQQCQNFDQFAMACQQNWPTALDLLQKGMIQQFLGGVGRMDLSQAAAEAANFPDKDRGLNELLGKFPTDVLEKPKLQSEPKNINLGTIKPGTDKSFELQITNTGGRLLYGSVTSGCKWLGLGEKPGLPQKIFKTGDETKLDVHIIGGNLRASDKPVQGKLVIESNGGSETIVIKAEVPVKPFPEGVLSGAKTPREIALKAKASPKESAALFEKGAVAKWYKDNGWSYPVRGNVASGVAAVQQFFEALGLVKPPKVKINAQTINLSGNIGQRFEQSFTVFTDEKRHLYVHAGSNQPWLRVKTIPMKANAAKVNVEVTVPNYASGTLQGKVLVSANGNQKFGIPVNLAVQGGIPAMAGAGNPFEGFAAPAMMAPAQAAVAPGPNTAYTAQQTDPMIGGIAPASQPTQSMAGNNFAFTGGGPSDNAFEDIHQPGNPTGYTTAPQPGTATLSRRRETPKVPLAVHLTPLLLLFLVLGALMFRDLISGDRDPDEGPSEPKVAVTIKGDDKNNDSKPKVKKSVDGIPIEPKQYLLYRYNPEKKRVGITENETGKQLTFTTTGLNSSALLKIGDFHYEFGGPWGKFIHEEDEPPIPLAGRLPEKTRSKNVWLHKDGNIQVTQVVDILPSKIPVKIEGEPHRLLDTCLIAYKIQNVSKRKYKVGFRYTLDTFIGKNDGVPFTVPGKPGMIKDMFKYSKEQIPDFIQALEKPDLVDPGTIANLSFRIAGLEFPSEVRLTRWPGHTITGPVEKRIRTWDIPMKSMQGDSSVIIYWNPKILDKGDSRYVGFAYGLGQLTSSGGFKDGESQLALTIDGDFGIGQSFTIAAYVKDKQPNEKLTLELPMGLSLQSGKRTQPVPPPTKGTLSSIVTWRVKVERSGEFPVSVTSNAGPTQRRTIIIEQAPAKGKDNRTNPDNIFQ